MIGVSMSVNPADKARLLQLMTLFPRESYRGIGRAGSTIRSKLRKAMRKGGGVDGVPGFDKYNEWTSILHNIERWGGALGLTSSIQMYKDGKAARVIGFVSGLKKYAEYFQESEQRPLTDVERRMMYKTGRKPIAAGYIRPARPLIDPFADKYHSDFVKWAIRNTEKILEKAKK